MFSRCYYILPIMIYARASDVLYSNREFAIIFSSPHISIALRITSSDSIVDARVSYTINITCAVHFYASGGKNEITNVMQVCVHVELRFVSHDVRVRGKREMRIFHAPNVSPIKQYIILLSLHTYR